MNYTKGKVGTLQPVAQDIEDTWKYDDPNDWPIYSPCWLLG